MSNMIEVEIKILLESIIEDITLAESYGMSVSEMYDMFEEINTIEDDDCNCEEWPNWYNNGSYEDECGAESMY